MKLYIQIVDGTPFQHPILESNLLDAFPGINLDDEASGFAKFVRVEPPVLGPYEKNQTVTYELVDGVYTDVYKCEQLTPEEKAAKQNKVKQAFAQSPFKSWIFDETLCIMKPPVEVPDTINTYRWNEEKIGWDLMKWDETKQEWVKE